MPYLLDGHHDLKGVEAVEPEVVGEVRRRLDLLNSSAKPPKLLPSPTFPQFHRQLTFEGSLTYSPLASHQSIS